MLRRNPLLSILLILNLSSCAVVRRAPEPAPARWWRGNLHTHSLWSDGDDFPEMITDWYQRHGYDFLAISDHNTLAAGEPESCTSELR